MKIIDSHVHLNSHQFDEDREEVFKRIKENLDFVVNIGYDMESSEIGVEYANKYNFIYCTVGYHPDEIEGYSEENEKKLEELTKNPKVLAIGEIGLDYHWMTRPK
ncbi:TatD family hydrolase, partial [Fusobacterium gastrosuis]|uniref:TatD family hydrolase n=1 Tax=Fusobacterium gastrosuis TaxID=1755100 RepID=UPI002A9FA22B|nr:TatD family hydrolase [Fusobacterium gastrosuis]